MLYDSLKEEIKKHNFNYWINNNPEIDDIDYDSIVEELKKISPEDELVNFIGIEKEDSAPILLSLDKVYSKEELKKWAEKIIRNEDEKFIIQPKYDGWSGYWNGANLLSRSGENLNSKLSIIKLVSKKYDTFILSNINEEIFGEIILSNDEFKKLKDSYKTPRSALTGILTNEKLEIDNIILHFVDYDLFSMEVSFKDFDNIDWDEYHKSLKEWVYPTDGIVIKLKDKEYFESLGTTAHHPRGAIAFKHKNPSAITKLINVEWFVGKNGTVNPVAILEPVEINGHIIKKASLHNLAEIKRLDLKINDYVLIERCGEIIPNVKKNIKNTNEKERQDIIITNCPSCNGELKYVEPFLYCTNEECEGSLYKRLLDSCRKLELDNIGPAIIESLVEDCNVENIYDILTMKIEDIKKINRFKEKSVLNFYNEIERRKNIPIEDWKVLSALNIKNIGISVSKNILREYTLTELFDLDLEDIRKIKLIGGKRAEELFEGLQNNKNLIHKLIKTLKIMNTKIDTKNPRQILQICFTGKLSKPRNYYEKLAERKGFNVTNSVTKDTDYLVSNDIDESRGKVKKALKLGIKIINEEEFLKL